MTKANYDHSYWMSQAIQLAQQGLYSTRENPRVGCVIVKDDELLGKGFHAYAGQAHAEINALNDAAEHELAGCTIYVTLEPCSHTGKTPPCVDAVLAAKPKQVVIAMQDPNPLVAGKSIAKLKHSGIEVVENVLQAEAFALNPGFIKRMLCGLPYVHLKMAMSLDGKTALKNGQSEWISGKESRHDVQFLRARSCAILTGIQTVLNDDPSLNVRLTMQELSLDKPLVQPKRVVLDRQLKIPLDAKMLTLDGEIWIFTQSNDAEKIKQLEAKGCRVFIDQGVNKIDLLAVCKTLAKEGINEVHTECGSRLAGALVQSQLVDEMSLYMAPKLLGAASQSLLDLGELTGMDQALNVDILSCEKIGSDLKLQLKPLYH